ncbi:MAG: transposase, partial [Bacilli bacterium]
MEGSFIISDGWKGYSNIIDDMFEHETVIHSENFVNPECDLIHTNAIERVWRSLRKEILYFEEMEDI